MPKKIPNMTEVRQINRCEWCEKDRPTTLTVWNPAFVGQRAICDECARIYYAGTHPCRGGYFVIPPDPLLAILDAIDGGGD
jgi:hypothetical protein